MKSHNPSRIHASVLLDHDDQESPHTYQSLPIQRLKLDNNWSNRVDHVEKNQTSNSEKD